MLAEFDYDLPQELIAQIPARRRELARMLLLNRVGGAMRHGQVTELIDVLRPGDLLVMNNSKVVPARLATVKPSGGAVEVFLLNPALPQDVLPDGSEVHQVLLRGKVTGPELYLRQNQQVKLRLLHKGERGQALLAFPGSALAMAGQYGSTPLPPYIKRGGDKPLDKLRYQTVYACRPGAVAAPTAGLHLSKKLLAALQQKGVKLGYVTLHVGYGTFAQPSAQDLAAGRLHCEWVEIQPELAALHAGCRAQGGRVIAVGTTSARALEWAVQNNGLEPRSDWCSLMIAPGHEFKALDGLLTNFHLPRTTLLMLVAALAGRENVLAAYAEAVRQKYRFYSYGDAMLII